MYHGMTAGENESVESPNAPAPETPTSPPASETPETPEAAADPQSAQEAGSGESPAAEGQAPATPTMKRGLGPLAAAVRRPGSSPTRGAGVAKPTSPAGGSDSAGTAGAVSTEQLPGGKQKPAKPFRKDQKRPRRSDGKSREDNPLRPERPTAPKINVPSKRSPLPEDIQAELDAELAAANVDELLSGSAGMADRAAHLTEGQRVHATVLKIHDDSVFIALGGPDEGMVPFEHFEEEPTAGQSIEVIVRGFNRDDGLYVCVLPGQAIDVADLSDLEEGAVVEATVTGTNSGGLEVSVGGASGFIPISQISEHRVEDTSDFVGQKLVCIITECKPHRRRLVLSRRAVLEREREERRREQLEQMEVGDTMEGIVRSVKDFGAFVDLGGCDGMIHISKLSWDRVKHPSDVLEVGQKVKVKVDQVDKQTGKISLSYRDLIANPWDTVDADFPVGQVVQGTVSRVANFGAFVRLGAGIEGLVHISELAHHRVSRVTNVVNEGDTVDVKVQSIDRDAQRIALSLKAAIAPPADAKEGREEAEETLEPPREPAVKPQHQGPLRGGTGGDTGGERFGLRW